MRTFLGKRFSLSNSKPVFQDISVAGREGVWMIAQDDAYLQLVAIQQDTTGVIVFATSYVVAQPGKTPVPDKDFTTSILSTFRYR